MFQPWRKYAGQKSRTVILHPGRSTRFAGDSDSSLNRGKRTQMPDLSPEFWILLGWIVTDVALRLYELRRLSTSGR